MAKVIEAVQPPALVLAHNKTLAAQLYHEFRLFSRQRRRVFVSPTTTTISRRPTFRPPTPTSKRKRQSTTRSIAAALRHALAVRAPRLHHRRQRVLHLRPRLPEAYYGMLLLLEKGQQITRDEISATAGRDSVRAQRYRFQRGTFRVRGDVIEVFPTYEDTRSASSCGAMRSNASAQIDPLTGRRSTNTSRMPIYPKTHYVMPRRPDEARRSRASKSELVAAAR